MSKISRREFLSRGVAGVAVGAALAAPVVASPKARVIGANDTINMAIIGIRGRGGSLIDNFAKMKNVHLKYLVDTDENIFESRVQTVERIAGYKPQTEWDMRKVFEDPEIDAVGIATPNHWHALASIWAAQAGKHVYVEKPACHNVFEGRKMVEAARKYNVFMQVGFQNRSRKNANAAMKFLHDGKLGKIYMARGLCYKQRGPIGRYPDGPVAAGTKYFMDYSKNDRKPLYTEEYLSKVHYDMWLGPAPKRPFNANRFHYNWHWHWDYGNGDTGNQGPHQFDVARWGLNKEEYPVKLRSFGGYFAYDSSQETPNTQTSIFEYADGTILEFATRGLSTNPEGILANTPFQDQAGKLSLKTSYRPVDIGDLFFGSEGWMQVDSGGDWQTFFGYRNEPGPSSAQGGDSQYDPNDLTGGGDEGHFSNFIEALRSGKQENLNCDIEVGHLSTALPLIANVSYRLGRELMFDGSTEKFVDDKEADAMLTREYRAPYVVPQNV